jgi:hypothetical protein
MPDDGRDEVEVPIEVPDELGGRLEDPDPTPGPTVDNEGAGAA